MLETVCNFRCATVMSLCVPRPSPGVLGRRECQHWALSWRVFGKNAFDSVWLLFTLFCSYVIITTVLMELNAVFITQCKLILCVHVWRNWVLDFHVTKGPSRPPRHSHRCVAAARVSTCWFFWTALLAPVSGSVALNCPSPANKKFQFCLRPFLQCDTVLMHALVFILLLHYWCF